MIHGWDSQMNTDFLLDPIIDYLRSICESHLRKSVILIGKNVRMDFVLADAHRSNSQIHTDFLSPNGKLQLPEKAGSKLLLYRHSITVVTSMVVTS